MLMKKKQTNKKQNKLKTKQKRESRRRWNLKRRNPAGFNRYHEAILYDQGKVKKSIQRVKGNKYEKTKGGWGIAVVP